MELQQLIKKIESANRRYYNSDPTGEEISDIEYDALKSTLEKLDPDHPLLSQVGVPAMGEVYRHTHPVGSQEKLKNREEFVKWTSKFNVADGMVLQYKLDGLTVVLYYEQGKLIRALTRGDGAQGEDVTRNVLHMQNVKQRLPGFTGFIRGEAILDIHAFKQIFKPLGFSNPRNTTAGKIRDQKASPELLKHFKVIYFDALDANQQFGSESDVLAFMRTMSLETVTSFTYNSSDEIWQKYESIRLNRSLIPYEIDGVIVRVNNLAVQSALGTSNDLRPKGQRCIKFDAAQGVSTLLSVELTIGHTGAIVPSARVKPVEIGGVTVSNVFLNNFEEIQRLGIHIGDEVQIIRAGDVIPKIVGVATPGSRREQIKVPTICLHCSAQLVKDGANIFCRNAACDGQQLRRLKTWVTKRDIKFLGDSLLELLYHEHGVREPWQLYTLSEEFLSKCDRGNGVVGTASKQITAELDKSRVASLPDFLGSLSIPFLGRRQVEIMIETCDLHTVDDFINVTASQLETLPGFSDGSTKARAIVTGISRAKGLINKMQQYVKVDDRQAIVTTGQRFSGMALCFTGVRPKPEEEEVFIANGGTIKDSMTKAVTHLVMKSTDSTSSKAQKAIQLGANLMSYDDFKTMLLAKS